MEKADELVFEKPDGGFCRALLMLLKVFRDGLDVVLGLPQGLGGAAVDVGQFGDGWVWGCRGCMLDPAEGVSAAKLLRSGVMERSDGFGWGVNVDGLGVEVWFEVDHEKTGAEDVVLFEEPGGRAGADVPQGSSSASCRCGLLTPPAPGLPRTSCSKSPSPLESMIPLDPVIALKDMKSSVRSLRDSLAELEARSWSLRVCSCSTRLDNSLMRSMNV